MDLKSPLKIGILEVDENTIGSKNDFQFSRSGSFQKPFLMVDFDWAAYKIKFFLELYSTIQTLRMHVHSPL